VGTVLLKSCERLRVRNSKWQATVVRGVKGCGKTETAKQHSKSEVNLLVEKDAKIAEFSLKGCSKEKNHG
jgi:hypothetical protein